jgi:hypothetical protein
LQEVFDAWRGNLEQTLRAEEDHPVLLSHVAKYRSLMPSLALIGHLIDGVAGGPSGPVSRAAAARAVAWCEYLQGHARRLYASVTDQARVAAAVLATKITHGRVASPFTAREVYRNEWTGLTEPRIVQGALEGLAELGWVRPETVRARDGGRPTVRFRLWRPSTSTTPRLIFAPVLRLATTNPIRHSDDTSRDTPHGTREGVSCPRRRDQLARRGHRPGVARSCRFITVMLRTRLRKVRPLSSGTEGAARRRDAHRLEGRRRGTHMNRRRTKDER